ncbi:MAG TPA: MgtC/SapB family protein [Terriglobales bacterium]|nr:MgtC/SapB family protein [Terriglobales bacterium]
MTEFFKSIWHVLNPTMDLASFVSGTVLKLILAAILGGAVGLEREIKHKPAGLRTNMFICFGAALYTILSFRYSEGTLDRTRIAAQIISGIGFIGAGSILHSRGSVSGITTAATMFVVASIGMAVGGGEYLSAIFATLVILVALNALGWVEHRFNFKSLVMMYEVNGPDADKLMAEVNRILERRHLIPTSVQSASSNGGHRVQFTVEAKRSEHEVLVEKLRETTELGRVITIGGSEFE